ncbi:MAG: hypothetical protein J6O41_04835 [Clostridia bacterium]|nr:hypothetical protein [Clostridia bacterium]
MTATVVYDNRKDRELLELIDSKFPIFIQYIDFNTKDGRKEAFQVKSHWAAKLNPFVVVEDEDKIIKVFYSEESNAIQQLINYLNDPSKI